MNDFIFIVGFAGRTGVGKTDTLLAVERSLTGLFHRRKVRPTIHNLSFEVPALTVAYHLLGEFPENDTIYRIGRKSYTGREVIEGIEQGFFDHIPGVWGKCFMDAVDGLSDPLPLILADDVRLTEQANCCDYLVCVSGSAKPTDTSLLRESQLTKIWGWEGDKSMVFLDGGKHDPPVKDVAKQIIQAWEETLYVKNVLKETEE